MRRFLTKLALFLLGLLAITQGTSLLIRTVLAPTEHTDYQRQIAQALALADTINVLTVGSSHNLAIDFPTLGVEGYHLWRGGADFFEVNYQLKALLPRLSAIDTVLVVMPYGAFATDNGVDEERQSQRRWMYGAIPSWPYIQGDETEYMVGNLSRFFPFTMLVRPDHMQLVITALSKPGYRVPTVWRGKDNQLLSSGYLTCEAKSYHELSDVAYSKDGRVRLHQELRTVMLENHTNLRQDAFMTLATTIELLQARKIRVVLYTPPYFSIYTELSDLKEIQVTMDFIHQLQAQYDIEYYNFATDPAFIYDASLFQNEDHLNLCGAKQFSMKFRQALTHKSS